MACAGNGVASVRSCSWACLVRIEGTVEPGFAGGGRSVKWCERPETTLELRFFEVGWPGFSKRRLIARTLKACFL